MNPEGGFTRSYRRMWDNPVFRNYQEAAVFSWMKDAAQWKGGRISTKFGPVVLGVGELLIAERVLADKFAMHRNTLRALIQRMSDDGMIELFRDRCTHRAGTVVRVLNYSAYQGLEDAAGPKEDRKEAASRTVEGPKEDRSGTKNNEGNNIPLEADASRDVAAEPDDAEPSLIKLDRAETITVETLKEMGAIWREECGDVLSVPRALDKPRQNAMRRRYLDTFDGSLDRWRDFCRRVRGSPFLTGDNQSGWRADIDFMLKPKNANKLLEGGYDDRKATSASQQHRPARTVGRDDDAGIGGILDGLDYPVDACRAAAAG